MIKQFAEKRICVIGGGRWGQNHIRTLHEIGNLGGIVESNANRMKELLGKYPNAKGYSTAEEALNDGYDGFVVATPAETHFKLGCYLLKHKQNVLIEKPMTLSSNDSMTLIQMAKKSGSKLMVGHILLFHPAIKKIKEIIDEGKIGKLLYLYSTRLNLGTVRTEENVFWSFAPHDISIFDYLIGKSPISISASGGCFLQNNIHDMVITHFIYPDNIRAHIFVSWLHPFKEQRLVVIGDKGMLMFEDSSKERNITFYDEGIYWVDGLPAKWEKPDECIEYEVSSPLENELRYFIEHLDLGVTIADGRSGYEVVKILEKTAESLANMDNTEVEVSKYAG